MAGVAAVEREQPGSARATDALAAAADLLREAAAGFDAAATSCRAWAAGI